jgi:5-methylcytosine-specific restriction enzyme subunit McrC
VTVHLSVREHDLLVRGEASALGERNVTPLSAEAFDAVEALILGENSALSSVATPTKFARQDALKLSQWVGLIRTPDGTTIEILPKTHERSGTRQLNPEASLYGSRALLMRMLVATDERFRTAPPADLDTARMPLFEILLRSVLDGIKAAVRRGIPHAYVAVAEERASLRGRLDLPRQVRQPPHRAHRLNVVYDEFLPDRSETRLTRLTVERVARLTRHPSTKQLARELLVVLENVPPSRDIRRDFAAWRLERGHAHFVALEGLCRMVLYELNPLVGGMTARAQAVLFDMNKVYEAYVAHLIRTQHPEWQVQTQVTDRALGNVGTTPAFRLRPDLLITLPSGEVIVADTKWKRLKLDKAPTFDIANADAYQMLAYSTVFQRGQAVRNLHLIYPHLVGLPPRLPAIALEDGGLLHLSTIDLKAALPLSPFASLPISRSLPLDS